MRGQFATAFVIAFCSSATLAHSTVPTVSARAQQLNLALAAQSEEPACAALVEPWRDSSSFRFFATGATARLDAQELAAGQLAQLISLRFADGALRLVALGSPIRSGLQFTTTGWRARWPFC